MIRINEIRLELDDSEDILGAKAAKILKVNKKYITKLTIYKKSVDARKKDDVHFHTVLTAKYRLTKTR